jgi:V8-like Glu-specific endopeptidase
MLRILHTAGRRAPAIEHFGQARLCIGTAPGSDVAYAAGIDPGVMPRHAEIRREGAAYYLIDLGTPTGTFVNRVRVGRHALRNGDLVHIGGAGGPELRVEIAEAAAVSADADGRVDLETAARLVRAAVLQDGLPHDRAAAIIEHRVGEAKRRAAIRTWLLALGVLVSLGATLVAAALVYRSQRAAAALAEEAGMKGAPAARPVGEIPTHVYTGRAIYDENRAALYVIGYVNGNKVGGVCTAFAIRPDVLATNAHCILALREHQGMPIVTQNDSNGKVRFTIRATQMHPDYKAKSASADSPDVGLLRASGRLPKLVTLASDAELRAIGPGDDAYVLGFPGRVMDPVSPSATFLKGHIGRTMSLDERPAAPDLSVLLLHDAVTRGGNSGSPIFNQYGHVIGIHAAHLDEEQEVRVGGEKTTVVESSAFRIGMRVDLLAGVPAP